MIRKVCLRLPALLLAVGLISGCGESIEPGRTPSGAPPTVSAPVEAARLQTQPFLYEAVGTITARTASTVASKLMGTVLQVKVQEGASVKEGDVLVVLDQRQVSARYEQAQAAVQEARKAEASARSAREAAKAAADLARTTYARYVQLLKESSVSQQEFDEVAARHRQADATLTQTTSMLEAAGNRVQQAQAALDAANVNRKDAVVRAPYSGRITAKMIDVGDLASPGTPFFTIEKAGVFCADLVLPEDHIESVRLDQQVTVRIPALGNAELFGRIGRIVPSADPKSRSFLVKVGLPEDERIRSGMFARVLVPVGKSGMLLIPDSAVVRRGQLTGIYLVDPEERASFRLIREGKHFGDQVEVISGLHEGDRYVVAPPPTIVDGAKVEVPS
jgi:multidrug efflux pump subunit AcrA (membrane-fusion protein)